MTIRKLAAAFVVLLGIGSIAVTPASAIELQTALQQGLVGEKPDGYLAPVGSPSAEVQELVQKVNDWRRQQYRDIAAKHGQTLQEVELVAGRKRIQEASPGTYVLRDGQWVRK